MPGFWLKAIIAAVVVILVVYGAAKLLNKWPGCLTRLILFVTLLISPILWLIINLNIPFYYLEPYKGRVVEKDTGNPIPGAAVMVKYYEVLYGFETIERFIDAKEGLTNQNGEYFIQSEWQLRRGGTPYGQLQIFKPDYWVVEKYLLNFPATMFSSRFDHRFWNTGFQIYELNKLETKEERLRNLSDVDTGEVDPDKIRHTIIYVDEERQYLGLKPMYPHILEENRSSR